MAIKQQIDFLKQAIRSNDLDFLKTIPHNDFKKLNMPDKIACLKLFRLNIDTFGLNTEILEIVKVLLDGGQTAEFRHALDAFCKELGRKTNEYSRMCYLKGKIEYLKEKIVKSENVDPENEMNLNALETESNA